MKFYFQRSVFFLAISAVVAGFAFAGHSRAAGAQQTRYRHDLHPQWNYVPGRVIVKFRPEIKSLQASPQVNAIRSAYQVAAIKPLFPNAKNKFLAEKAGVGLSRIFVLEVPAGADIGLMVRELNRHPAVEYAEPDYLIPADVVPPPQVKPSLPTTALQNGRSGAQAFNATPNDPRRKKAARFTAPRFRRNPAKRSSISSMRARLVCG